GRHRPLPRRHPRQRRDLGLAVGARPAARPARRRRRPHRAARRHLARPRHRPPQARRQPAQHRRRRDRRDQPRLARAPRRPRHRAARGRRHPPAPLGRRRHRRADRRPVRLGIRRARLPQAGETRDRPAQPHEARPAARNRQARRRGPARPAPHRRHDLLQPRLASAVSPGTRTDGHEDPRHRRPGVVPRPPPPADLAVAHHHLHDRHRTAHVRIRHPDPHTPRLVLAGPHRLPRPRMNDPFPPSAWERRLERVVETAPHLTLALSLLIYLSTSDGETVRALALTALALAWILGTHTLLPAAVRRRRAVAAAHFAGVLVTAGLLILHDPIFIVYCISGFFLAARFAPSKWTFAAVAATSFVLYGAALDWPQATVQFAAFHLVIVAVQTLTIGGGHIIGIRLEERQRKYRKALSDLQTALEENADLHAQLLAQAHQAG